MTSRSHGLIPNFLIVGASRSGTTSVHHYLSKHPDVFLAPTKELRFFDRAQNYDRGLDFYRSQFTGWSGQRVVAEAWPPYFFRGITFDSEGNHRYDDEDDAPRRIRESLPEARIFITLRNPAERAYSQYWKNRAQQREPAPTFRRAIEDELAGQRSPQTTGMCWLYKNRYSVHVGRWLELFPMSACHVVVFEEWTADPGSMLGTLADFLDIDPAGMPADFPVLNVGSLAPRNSIVRRVRDRVGRTSLGTYLKIDRAPPPYPPLDPDTRRFVLDVLKEDIEQVEAMLDQSLEVWRKA